MARDDPIVSPWVLYATDNEGEQIQISVAFDNTTRALTGATVTRAANCSLGHIYLGLGADGTPNSTATVFAVPTGTTNITTNQLRQRGLNVIEDVFALQFTAGA